MIKLPPGLEDKAVHLAYSFIGKIDRVAKAARFELEQTPIAPFIKPGLRQLSALWQNSPMHAIARLNNHPQIASHPHWNDILSIIRTSDYSEDYPTISSDAFQKFIKNIPHLFAEGAALLELTNAGLEILKDAKSDEERRIAAGLKVIETMVNTAALTAPAEGWGLRYILSALKASGVATQLARVGNINHAAYALAHKVDAQELYHQLESLYARGLLNKNGDTYLIPDHHGGFVWDEVQVLHPEMIKTNIAKVLIEHIKGNLDQSNLLDLWLADHPEVSRDHDQYNAWVMDYRQIQLSYYLMPLVLALTSVGMKAKAGTRAVVDNLPQKARGILEEAAYIDEDGLWTPLAQRVFKKGPGPFGIIYAYWTKFREDGTALERDTNIFGSAMAHGSTFEEMVSNGIRYVTDTEEKPPFVMEHAVGNASAHQQWLKQTANNTELNQIQLLGFDYENKALDSGARQLRSEEKLPPNTILEQADIGNPAQMTQALKEHGISKDQLRQTLMFVGAGLHEIRQSDQEIVGTMSQYEQLGIVIVANETTDYSSEQLRSSGWQSYHGIFRYLHWKTGQVLRPDGDYGAELGRMSWPEVVVRANYEYLPQYSSETRRLFPVKMDKRLNPPHRRTYFLRPKSLIKKAV